MEGPLAVSVKLIMAPINSEIVLLTFTKLIWKIHSHTKVSRGMFITDLFINIKKLKVIKMPFTG